MVSGQAMKVAPASKQALLSQVDELLGSLEEPANDDAGPVKVFSVGRPKPFLLQDHFPGT